MINIAISLFLGALHGWALATPSGGGALWWLELFTLAWLVHRLARVPKEVPTAHLPFESPLRPTFGRMQRAYQRCQGLISQDVRRGFGEAWSFAIGWLVASLWWLYTSMHSFGGLAAPLAALAVLALCMFLGVFYALAGAAFVQLRRGKAGRDALLFGALWLLAELARGTLLTGFPWAAIGYAHIDGPLVLAAPWVGVYGISALAAGCAALLALTRSLSRTLLLLLLGIASFFPSFLMTAWQPNVDKASKPATSPALTVRLLQGNIPQNEKFDLYSGIPASVAWYKEQFQRAVADRVDLVIAPETSIPLPPNLLPAGYWVSLLQGLVGQSTPPQAATHDSAGESTTVALTGIPLGSQRSGYTNSVVALDRASVLQGAVAQRNAGEGNRPFLYQYDKHHLVPFGEFIPPFFRWFTDLLKIPLGDFNRGALVQPSFAYKGERFAINICFEDLFGEELAQRFRQPQQAPSVFVNVSNLAWFGGGIALDQHLNIARMRAIELNRMMLRATNTGATVVINRQGQVTQQLERLTRGALDVRIWDELGPSKNTLASQTPYTRWVCLFGLWPLGLAAFAVVVGCCAAQWRRKRAVSTGMTAKGNV